MLKKKRKHTDLLIKIELNVLKATGARLFVPVAFLRLMNLWLTNMCG